MANEINELALLKKNLTNEEKMQFDVQYANQSKSPTTALILSIFLGEFGVDRFYIGDTGIGVGKLLTVGGAGIWALIDWFLIQNACKHKNRVLATNIANSLLVTRN